MEEIILQLPIRSLFFSSCLALFAAFLFQIRSPWAAKRITYPKQIFERYLGAKQWFTVRRVVVICEHCSEEIDLKDRRPHLEARHPELRLKILTS